MKPQPSEVWSFTSPTGLRGKPAYKHHLCIDAEGIFLFVSTYRSQHPGGMPISNSAFPFLTPTEAGMSEISCKTSITRRFPDPTVPRKNPRGKVAKDVMTELKKFGYSDFRVEGAAPLTFLLS